MDNIVHTNICPKKNFYMTSIETTAPWYMQDTIATKMSLSDFQSDQLDLETTFYVYLPNQEKEWHSGLGQKMCNLFKAA